MPKALCLAGMVVAVLVLALFLFDLIASFAAVSIAPFRGASVVMDIAMIVCGLLLGYASWTTLKEQV